MQKVGPMKSCSSIPHHWIELENVLLQSKDVFQKSKPEEPELAFISSSRMKNLAACWTNKSQERVYAVFRFNNIVLLREQVSNPWQWELGHAFESLVTGKNGDGEFYSVNCGPIGTKTLFVCCEIDACVPGESGEKTYVELKMEDPRNDRTRLRLRQTLFQTTISGVKMVRYGVHNASHLVSAVKDVAVEDLLEKPSNKDDSELQFQVLDNVLDMIQKCVEEKKMYFLHLPAESNKVTLYSQDKCESEYQAPPPKAFADYWFHKEKLGS